MWAVNEADLSAQTASGYVHVVMLHHGLGVGLAVVDLLPLLPPPVRRLRAQRSLHSARHYVFQNALSMDAMFSCTGIFALFSKMSSSEATSYCSASVTALTKSDSLVLSSCS